MTENDVLEAMVKTEVGEDTSLGDENSQPLALLLRVTQSNGRPLPIGGLTGQMMSQVLHEITGVIPKEVLVKNDQEVVMEFEEDTPIVEVSKVVHGLFHCSGKSLSVNSLLARRDTMTDIVRQCEVGWERQRDLKHEHHRM